MKTCRQCGAEFDPSQDDPQRRFAVICLECDLAAWEMEQKEWEAEHHRTEALG